MTYGRGLGIRIALGAAFLVVMGPTIEPGRIVAAAPPSRVLRERFQLAVPDSADVLAQARRAQARFERRRRTMLPWTFGESSRPCDNRVGRFCHWYEGDGGWRPVPDPPELIERRGELLAELSTLSSRIPGDRWILGQRVFYLSEAGRWGEAASLARACGVERIWWCHVLLGFALHGQGEYRAAMSAFRKGFAAMDPEEANEWWDPERLLDGRAQSLMRDATSEDREALTARFWLMADPLYLMPGNDRETEHYARMAYSRMSDRARSPRGVAWGSDLEELTVRYGWARGWERRRPSVGTLQQQAGTVGHELPETREFVPPGWVLERPWRLEPGAWRPTERPRSAHVAPYAPDLDPGVGQVAVLHRGDSIVVAAATRLPDQRDSTTARLQSGEQLSPEPEAPPPWTPPGPPDEPDQIGMFLVNHVSRLTGTRSRGATEGALTLTVPAGRYLLSLEAWAPREGRAGRVRHGVTADTVPVDLATLSDLIILESGDGPPQNLRLALPRMRPSLELTVGQSFAVAWEVFGLGWREETVDFELSLSSAGEGFFAKVGRWLGMGGESGRPLQIRWSEPGPVETGPWFRSVRIDVPDLEPGEYLLRLSASIRGREPLVRTRGVKVVVDSVKVGQP